MRSVSNAVLVFLLGFDRRVADGTPPNIIVMQPDDLPFFEAWSPPPNTPSAPARQSQTNLMPSNYVLPNIERLRTEGLQMMEAYAAAPMCGTSRYTTITGRYASRAATSRATNQNPAQVTIPMTKLEDIPGYGNDCSEDNIAVQFQNGGYSTSMFGKWHLSSMDSASYTYESAVETVKGCGFDKVGCLYFENLSRGESGFNADGTFSHNMECLTYEAVEFIKAATGPFFMYFNPTVPHSANGVDYALEEFSCRDTPNGTLDYDPLIPGMTEAYGNCQDYRDSIFDRAGETTEDLGPIWLDDAVGALLTALDDKGILNNTIFLFQEDHGMESKSSLYETGLRIPQFIYSPALIAPGSKFYGPVSTIDIGPTMLDFAGISSLYDMDGKSWKNAIGDNEIEESWKSSRCLFFEHEKDRAARCGCDKNLALYGQNAAVSTTWQRGNQQGLSNDINNLFDLCGATEFYVDDPDGNGEVANLIFEKPEVVTSFADLLQCHLDRTDPLKDPSFTACDLGNTTEPEVDPGPPRMTEVPIVGGVTTTSAIIGFRTSQAVKAKIFYSTKRRVPLRNRKGTDFVMTDASNDFTATIRISALQPDVKYYYHVYIEGATTQDRKRRSFKTFPQTGGDCAIAVFADVDNTDKPAPVYKRGRKAKPDVALQIGNMDHSSPQSLAASRTMHRRMRDPERQHGEDLSKQLLRHMPLEKVFDDQDYCGDDTDKTCPSRDAAVQSHNEYYPSYDKPDPEAIYRKFTCGVVEVFMLDTRTHRTPDTAEDDDSKTMLGEEQKAWLKDGLLSSDAVWKLVVSTVSANKRIRPLSIDHWKSFETEAEEMKSFLSQNEMENVVMVSGGAQTGGGVDDGSNNRFGIPELGVAHTNLARGNAKPVGEWSEGVSYGDGEEKAGYGLIKASTQKLVLKAMGLNKETDNVRHSLKLLVQ